MKVYNMLIPSYAKDFKCIGGECQDSCCVGWRVLIDKNTFKNYKKVIDKNFREKLAKYVKRNRHSINEYDYANIKLLEDKSCPFLNEKKLCEIFINIGEGNLSKVCTIYPRVYNRIDNVFEKSLTLSCPVAAKKVLLNKNLMEFDQLESSENLCITQREIDTINTEKYIEKYFWEIRIFIIDLLQNREYFIEDRLIILGMFCNEINENSNVSQVIKKFRNRLTNNTYKQFLDEITDGLNVKLIILKQIIDIGINLIDNSGFLDLYNKSMEGLGGEKETDVVLAYNKCYKNYYKKFIMDKEYIIENFLVNYAFQNTFPLGRRKIFDEYIMMIVYYSLIKIHLVGLSGFYKQDFSENIVVEFIQKFSKLILHNSTYTDWIFNNIKENKIDTMAYMAIFIKH